MPARRPPIESAFLVLRLSLFLCIIVTLMSASAGSDLFANGANTSFPFEWDHGMIVVPVSLAGSRPLRFILDTGSTRILIDRGVAASLGLKEGTESSLQGAGSGRQTIHALHHVDLHLPGLGTRNYDCFTIDLSSLEHTLGTRPDGIIGYDFFARFAVTIDFTARRIKVARAADFHATSLAKQLPLRIVHKWPFVKGELVLPGPVEVQDSFLIDSGSSDAVGHPIVKALENATATESGVGLGSPTHAVRATATAFRIGGFTIPRPLVSCCGSSDETSRLIGTSILRHFTVTFDYASSCLFLQPNEKL